jgi:hypothetical protein
VHKKRRRWVSSDDNLPDRSETFLLAQSPLEAWSSTLATYYNMKCIDAETWPVGPFPNAWIRVCLSLAEFVLLFPSAAQKMANRVLDASCIFVL